MTQKQFAKALFRHSEVIIYHSSHPSIDMECILVGIDFDGELLKLVPLDVATHGDRSFWANIIYCDKEK